jgi:hypothetical protein
MARGWTGIAPAKLEGRYLFACPKPNCYRRLTFKSFEKAKLEEVNHSCPYWGGETKVSWSVAKTLVQQLWDKLDIEYSLIVESQAQNPDETKGRARAFAESIAIFMPPFFSTADDVVREAGRRYKADKAGEQYETPGLGSRRYEGAIREDSKHTPRSTKQAPNQTSIGAVDEQTRKAIEFALDSGMFSAEELSKTYKLSIDVVKLIGKS